jgi:hypothetical protein
MVSNKRSASTDAATGASVETPFPRGGAILTALEQRKISLQAKADFERDASSVKRVKKRRSASLAEAGHDDEEVRDEGGNWVGG